MANASGSSRHTILVLIASICHEANRQYCLKFMNDDSQPAWADAPGWQAQSALNGVEAIADGRVTKPSQSHESWLAEKVADGWKYGPVKNVEAKEHPCFVPYDELPELQRHKDALFFSTASTLLYAFGLQAPSVEQNIESAKAELRRADAPLTRRYPVEQKTLDDVDRRFTYHSPKNDQPARYIALRREGQMLAHLILENTPPSREQSLALTNLEQALFWANASIARNE